MTLKNRFEAIAQRIAAAEKAAGRPTGSVMLVAVSKKHPASAIRQLASLGQRDFGESYLDEALDKQRQLADLSLNWHFIGPIQSNKTRGIAENFDWVHSVDRIKIADRLSAQRPADREPLKVFIQVNIDREQSKSGVMPEQLTELLAHVRSLPRIEPVGLMTIPRPAAAGGQPRLAFDRLRQLRDDCATADCPLPLLSMGMSDDLDEAVAAGATHVRIGTALFGARE